MMDESHRLTEDCEELMVWVIRRFWVAFISETPRVGTTQRTKRNNVRVCWLVKENYKNIKTSQGYKDCKGELLVHKAFTRS